MSQPRSVPNLGLAVEADAEIIEKELRTFWEAASRGESESAVVRACSCNVVVLARSSGEAAEVLPVLARVSESHPHRSIVAWIADAESGPDRPRMQAWIGAQCSVPLAGAPQVCSESVSIAAPRRMIPALPAFLSALVVPDLPVFLYWRSLREDDREVADGMARFADVLVVDSHVSKEDPAGRKRLLETLVSPRGWRAVRDLNWARLTPWRDLLSQFFDAPAARHHARAIRRVDITRSIAAGGKIPTRTLLLTGWLASRLDWQLAEAVPSGDCWHSTWHAGPAEVDVRFTGRPEGPGRPAGISSIRIETTSGAVFSVAREGETGTIAACSEGTASPLSHHVPEPGQDEGVLLAGEFSLAGEDSGFQAALARALELECRFGEAGDCVSHG